MCGFLQGKPHGVRQRHQPRQEIRGTWDDDDLFPMLSRKDVTALISASRANNGGASPGFPVELGEMKELHAAFLEESRTREDGWCRVQEIRVAPSFHPTYAGANVGHPPLLSPYSCISKLLKGNSGNPCQTSRFFQFSKQAWLPFEICILTLPSRLKSFGVQVIARDETSRDN